MGSSSYSSLSKQYTPVNSLNWKEGMAIGRRRECTWFVTVWVPRSIAFMLLTILSVSWTEAAILYMLQKHVKDRVTFSVGARDDTGKSFHYASGVVHNYLHHIQLNDTFFGAVMQAGLTLNVCFKRITTQITCFDPSEGYAANYLKRLDVLYVISGNVYDNGIFHTTHMSRDNVDFTYERSIFKQWGNDDDHSLLSASPELEAELGKEKRTSTITCNVFILRNEKMSWSLWSSSQMSPVHDWASVEKNQWNNVSITYLKKGTETLEKQFFICYSLGLNDSTKGPRQCFHLFKDPPCNIPADGTAYIVQGVAYKNVIHHVVMRMVKGDMVFIYYYSEPWNAVVPATRNYEPTHQPYLAHNVSGMHRLNLRAPGRRRSKGERKQKKRG